MNRPVPPLFELLGEDFQEPLEVSDDLEEPSDEEPCLDPPEYIGWVPSTGSATVAGRQIGGMVYIGELAIRSIYGGYDKCSAHIDPSLPVAETGIGKNSPREFFQPAYHRMSPERRASYLDWLAAGRSDVPYDFRYIALYLFGLERRFALDNPPDAEKREILDEARRLKHLSRDGLVRGDLDEFIQFGNTSMGDISEIEPIYRNYPTELPISLKIAIGSRVAHRKPLSADWALSWFLCHPGCQPGLAAWRCPDEFRALFRLRFARRFPEGLKLNKPKSVLVYTYRSASGEFRTHFDVNLNGMPVPDVSGLRNFPKIVQEIGDEVSQELNNLSRYLARDPKRRSSLGDRVLLPQELWSLSPCKKLDRFRNWARKISAKGGLIPVDALVAKIERKQPGKITKGQLTAASVLLAQVGFGFAPDPKFALRAPRIGESVVIFDAGISVVRNEVVSNAYKLALLTAASGAFVAHADGKISESERESLQKTVNDTKNLSEQERRRLQADIEWMLLVAPGLAPLRRKLKDAPPSAAPAIRAALVSAACADGAVKPQEIAAIENIYKVLRLDQATLYSDLHSADMHSRCIHSHPAGSAALSKANQAEASSGAIQLDAERIASIHSDTDQVSSVLGRIFDAAADNSKSENAQETLLPGLDAKQAAFLKAIIAKGRWTEGAFHELCARFSLPASGAVEHINEWAFETYDDALLDEHDGYEVNAGIADALKKAFAGKGGDEAVETD